MATDRIAHPFVSAVYDAVMLPTRRPLGRQRQRTLADATGRVLEIGFGTGLSLPHYPDITELVGLEPDPHMRRRAHARIRATEPSFPVDLVAGTAEDLPFPDDAFDTVAVFLTLCTVEDPRRALREARRVLTADGKLLMLEHVRSHGPAVTWMQHALTPIWRNLAGGCHLDRETVATAEQAGFHFEHLWRSRQGRGSLVQGRAHPS